MNLTQVYLSCARLLRSLGLALVLATLSMRLSAADCDTAVGAQAFASKCSACHSREVGRHMTGPSLHDLDGRRAGTVQGFSFSSAMSDSGIVWSAASLDAFLASPQTYVPGTVMPFGGIRNLAERAALVCYIIAG